MFEVCVGEKLSYYGDREVSYFLCENNSVPTRIKFHVADVAYPVLSLG